MQKNRAAYPSLALTLASLLGMSGCSTLPARERNFDPSLCNRGAAYEAGMNDGQDGRAMSSSFLDSCREDLRAQGQTGYRSGYDAGYGKFEQRMREASAQQNNLNQPHDQMQAPTPPASTTNNNSGIQINIGNSAAGGSTGNSSSNPRAWFCTARAFTDDFEVFGPTQLETHQLAIQACMRKHHPMHCQSVKCQPNL